VVSHVYVASHVYAVSHVYASVCVPNVISRQWFLPYLVSRWEFGL
jgi:hypothetical protein